LKKRNKKLLLSWLTRLIRLARTETSKSFLVLFFKKELLSCRFEKNKKLLQISTDPRHTSSLRRRSRIEIWQLLPGPPAITGGGCCAEHDRYKLKRSCSDVLRYRYNRLVLTPLRHKATAMGNALAAKSGLTSQKVSKACVTASTALALVR
jgi:hypothetical protein